MRRLARRLSGFMTVAACGALLLPLSNNRVDAQSARGEAGGEVRLVISPKRFYGSLEPMEVRCWIENGTSRPVYLNPDLWDPMEVGIVIDFYDRQGHSLRMYSAWGTPRDYSGVDIREYVTKRWIKLEPDYFYGRLCTVPLFEPLRPGRYRMVGTYMNGINSRLSPEQQKELVAMGDQVVLERLRSNEVWIEIK